MNIVIPGCWPLQVSAGTSWSVSARIQGLIHVGLKLPSEVCSYFPLEQTWGCSQTCGNCPEASASCWGEEKDKTLVLGPTVWKHQVDISTPGSCCLSRFSQSRRHWSLLQMDARGLREGSAVPPLFLDGARVMVGCPNVSQESACFFPLTLLIYSTLRSFAVFLSIIEET